MSKIAESAFEQGLIYLKHLGLTLEEFYSLDKKSFTEVARKMNVTSEDQIERTWEVYVKLKCQRDFEESLK